MQRIPHDTNGFWLKEFKYIKPSQYVKKHYLDNASFIVYSINIRIDENDQLQISMPGPVPQDGIIDLYFGQQFSPHRNLDLYTKFYFDYDLSINRAGLFNTFSEAESEAGSVKVFHLDGDNLNSFYSRYGYGTVPRTTGNIYLDPDFFELYFGYARIQNFKPEYESIDKYEAISSQIFANLDDSCFKWIKLVDGYYEDLSEDDLKSSALIVDYKARVNVNKLKQWILDNFSDTLVELIGKVSTRTIDFSFMFYPPSATGMQLEDVPSIISPSGIIKTKLLNTVEFEIKKSLVNNSQKVFEIYFLDNETGDPVYGDSSLNSPEQFSLLTTRGTFDLKKMTPENSVFEDLSELDFPSTRFTVKYSLKEDVVKFLANHLNYTILIKVTDLTSERRQ